MDAANKERMRLLQVKRLEAVLKHPENRECFDCTALQPRWASTNLGIFLCMRCAGIHRSLGTHITKVKSISMDIWDEHMIVNCETIGNGGGKAIYEARLPAGYVKPSAATDTHVVERVTREKFERKAWHAPVDAPAPPAAPMGVIVHAATAVAPAHAPGHIHAQAHAPGHHGHAPTPGHHVVQGSVISHTTAAAPSVVIAASAGGATISKRAPTGMPVVAGTVVAPAPPTAPPVVTAAAAAPASGALSFFDTIATPPRTQQPQQPTAPQHQPAAKIASQPEWGDFFGSASTGTPVVSASSQSPLFPTPQQPPRASAPVDIFDPFAAAPPKPAGAMPTFSYAAQPTSYSSPQSMQQQQQQPQRPSAAIGGDPFSQLSVGKMTMMPSGAPASRAAQPAAMGFAAPSPAAPTRNAIDDLFS